MRGTFLLALFFLTPAALANSVQFIDITESTNITFSHHSAPEKKYIVESMSGGVLLFDYDNDTWVDIYFINSLTIDTADSPRTSKSHLYRNNRDGTFTDVTDRAGVAYPGWGMGGCVGDYDNDGWLDFYVTSLGGNKLYHNNANGTFTEMAQKARVTEGRWSAGCGFADYDQDGRLDLFVSNYVDFKLDDLPEFGKGRFCQYRGISVQCGPRGLPGAGDALYRNNGDGTFTDVAKEAGVDDADGSYGLGVVWTDVDGDGLIDLFVANDSRPNFLYRNKGNGSFSELGLMSGTAVSEEGSEQGSMGIAVSDYDQDGLFDFFITNFSDEYNTLYHHDRKLTYTDVSFASQTAESSFPYVGWGTEFFDYDNDGWVDLMVVNGHVYPQVDDAQVGTSYAQRKLLYRNNRDGTFSEISSQAGAALLKRRASRGAAFGDLDNDGDIDVVVNDLDGAPMILKNEGGNRKNWIRIKAEAPSNNRFGIGARVKVVAGEMVQTSEIRSGGSYLSQNDLRLHFGLDDLNLVDLIEVRWPGGGVTRLEKTDVNREITVRP